MASTTITFFRTVENKATGTLDMYPLPGQSAPDLGEIDPGKKTAGGMGFRESYPAGTVFATDMEVNTVSDHYTVMKIYPVTEDPKDSKDAPSAEMKKAWAKYLAAHPDWKNEAEGNAGKPKPHTPADDIRRLASEISARLAGQGFHASPALLATLIANIRYTQAHTLLTGPTGTGKSELVIKLGEALGLPVRIYDMGSMYDPLSQLLGNRILTPDPVTRQTVTSFEYAKFVEDVQRPGIILLDELSRANPMVLNILLPCLDSRRMLPVEMAGAGQERRVDVHPDCVFVATANIGTEYTGTRTLDAALADRFNIVEVNYMPAAEEAETLRKRFPGVSETDARKIAECCRRIREACRENGGGRTVSTRNAVAVASFVALGWSVREAMEAKVLPLFDPSGDEDSERQTVLNVIHTVC